MAVHWDRCAYQHHWEPACRHRKRFSEEMNILATVCIIVVALAVIRSHDARIEKLEHGQMEIRRVILLERDIEKLKQAINNTGK